MYDFSGKSQKNTNNCYIRIVSDLIRPKNGSHSMNAVSRLLRLRLETSYITSMNQCKNQTKMFHTDIYQHGKKNMVHIIYNSFIYIYNTYIYIYGYTYRTQGFSEISYQTLTATTFAKKNGRFQTGGLLAQHVLVEATCKPCLAA